MPRPPAMQWPNLTLAEMNNTVEMDSRIISQCFQSQWAFFFFSQRTAGWVFGKWLQRPVGFQSPSKLLLDSVILMVFLFQVPFFSSGMFFLVPPLDKEYAFSTCFCLSFLPFLEIMSSGLEKDKDGRPQGTDGEKPGYIRYRIGHRIFFSAAVPVHRYILTGTYIVLVKRGRAKGSILGDCGYR